MSNRNSYLTSKQVAELLMVSSAAVCNWALKGELLAKSTPGGHRRFLVKDIEKFAREKNIELNIVRHDKLKILIVDDDKDICDYLSIILNTAEQDIMVEISRDGFDAGTRLRTFFPDIVLLDLMMPGLDGFRVCKSIKQEHGEEHVRVIAITGNKSDENVQKILQAGAEGCLEKPINKTTLFKVLGLTSKVSNIIKLSGSSL